MSSICWEDESSHLFVNPAYSEEEKENFHQILREGSAWPGHLWLATSGSVSPKWVGLSKQAVLASAEAVNQHLNSDDRDVWINALPTFHVGGLGILARAYLSGAQVKDYRHYHQGKWNADTFFHFLTLYKGTLTALVPAQLHDLIALGFRSPSHLRAVIIGGGALIPTLYAKAKALGWPIYPSYGMTECASQVATASLDKGFKLQILPHVQCRVQEGRLCFSGKSLLSVYAYVEAQVVRFVDPKIDGWFVSEDRGEIHDGFLTVHGRSDAMVKVGGENVDLALLENCLQSLKHKLGIKECVTLFSLEDPRLGHTIHLVAEALTERDLQPLIDEFQKSVLPFEKIRGVHVVQELPRSPLGKILKGPLKELLQKK